MSIGTPNNKSKQQRECVPPSYRLFDLQASIFLIWITNQRTISRSIKKTNYVILLKQQTD